MIRQHQASLRLRHESPNKFDSYRLSRPLLFHEGPLEPLKALHHNHLLPPIQQTDSLSCQKRSYHLRSREEQGMRVPLQRLQHGTMRRRGAMQSCRTLDEKAGSRVCHNFVNRRMNKQKRHMRLIMQRVMGSGIDPWDKTDGAVRGGTAQQQAEQEVLRSYCMALKRL